MKTISDSRICHEMHLWRDSGWSVQSYVTIPHNQNKRRMVVNGAKTYIENDILLYGTLEV